MDEKKILAEANALNEAYLSAALFDANNQIEHLTLTLTKLVNALNDQGQQSIWRAVSEAEEALGWHND